MTTLGPRRALDLAPFVLYLDQVRDARRSDVAWPPPARPVEQVHDVVVVFDEVDDPAERWLAVCLCEQGGGGHGSLEAAVRDGWRHLREHGDRRPQVTVIEPRD